MIRPVISRVLIPALLSTPVWLSAQATTPGAPVAPATPAAPAVTLTTEQTESIMKQLEQIEGQIAKDRSNILSTPLAQFRKAAENGREALGLYLDCVRLEQFERKDLKQTDFQAWKERNIVGLEDEDFLNGLQLQLEFLVLSLQAQNVKEVSEMGSLVTALQAFMPKAVAAVEKTVKHTASGAVEVKETGGNGQGGNRGQGGGGGGGQRGGGTPGVRPGAGIGGGGGGIATSLSAMLRQDVRATEFSNAYLLRDFMVNGDWCYTPIDIGQIYDKVILPYYLEMRPTEVASQWDARINGELAVRKLLLSKTEFEVYYKEHQPDLSWQKALYLKTNGITPLQAMADMLKIVRENPSHPRAQNWLEELRTQVYESQTNSPLTAPPTNAAPATTTTTTAGAASN